MNNLKKIFGFHDDVSEITLKKNNNRIEITTNSGETRYIHGNKCSLMTLINNTITLSKNSNKEIFNSIISNMTNIPTSPRPPENELDANLRERNKLLKKIYIGQKNDSGKKNGIGFEKSVDGYFIGEFKNDRRIRGELMEKIKKKKKIIYYENNVDPIDENDINKYKEIIRSLKTNNIKLPF